MGKRYRSQLRDEQAARTREAIRDAARKVFEDVGFAGATIADIAAGAGVSQPTVYAVYGSKAGIVRAITEQLEQHAELPQAIEQMVAERDPARQLKLFVASHRRLFEGSAAILRASAHARATPEGEALAEEGNAKRRRGIDTLVAAWSTAGALRVPRKKAAETMWLLSSAEIFLLSIDVLGWTPAAYERWLLETLTRELFVD